MTPPVIVVLLSTLFFCIAVVKWSVFVKVFFTCQNCKFGDCWQ